MNRGTGLEPLAAFVDELRGAGVRLPGDVLARYAEAVEVVGHDAGGLYWAGRATLLSARQDQAAYDRVFDAFWHRGEDPTDDGSDQAGMPSSDRHDDQPDELDRPEDLDEVAEPDPAVDEVVDGDDPVADDTDGSDPLDPPDADDADVADPIVRASRREVLRGRDFAAYEDGELAEARALMAELRVTPSTRPSRRVQAARHRRGRLDLRRTVAGARHHGGEVVTLHRQRRTEVPRRLVLLLDVSGSMADYSRALLQFAQVAVTARTKVEVFTIGTRLSRLTRELRGHDPDVALARATAAVPDWAGGTRLGPSLRQFNDRWGVRGLARGAVVVLLSDGWERDDPQVLADELARLQRVAHRVVWVNPLKASPGYEPLARGMAAALPFVDEFVAGASLASLDEVARAIRDAGVSTGGSR